MRGLPRYAISPSILTGRPYPFPAALLGLGDYFWNGDIEAGYRYQLGPSGVSFDDLRANPAGVRVPLVTHYRKYTQGGFPTPTGKVELYSETLLEHGYAAVPEHRDPVVGPTMRQELALRYPLILTCAKNGRFCQTQHRALPSLRRRALDPEVELHPQLAASRGIRPGDWVKVESPDGSMHARARFNESLDPEVVCGEHGWWQACPELGAPAYDPFSAAGSNYNLLISNAAIDPTSGTVPHRSYLCQVTRVGWSAANPAGTTPSRSG
jgi:anaerobic selenocysteine-containing dehydrogenase